MKKGVKVPDEDWSDKEKVMLKTTASLLKEIEPLLFGYFLYYVEESGIVDKDLKKIPVGSSIIALADMYERISSGQLAHEDSKIQSFTDIEKLAGRTFPPSIVQALNRIIISSS